MTTHGVALYVFFWGLGLFASGVSGFYVLHRRGALSPTTVVAILLSGVGVLVGSKWQYRLEAKSLADTLALTFTDFFGGGRRLPLGLTTGILLAGLWCLVTRAPWRAVGDALGIGFSVLIPIGRMGCLAFGCCMGAVCGRWAPFCMTYPPGSEAYDQQLREGFIKLSATQSLPAHPLPLYFAAGSLVALAVLLAMLRRNVAPGMLLLAFEIMRPVTKLALEPLRANPSPSILMVLIPSLELGIALSVLLVLGLRRLHSAQRWRPAAAVTGALLVACLTHERAWAGPTGADMAAIQRYASDPVHNRSALLPLRRQAVADLPPIALLALGDARLRAGNPSAARRLFAEVISREPGKPWDEWAEIGLAWSAVRLGDLDEAQEQFESLSERGSAVSPFADLMLALLDVDAGRFSAAADRFNVVLGNQEAAASVRQAAAIGRAYSYLWSGDYRQAAIEFDRAGPFVASTRLWDDARYGGAIARLRAGDRDQAREALRYLAAVPSLGGSRGSRTADRELRNGSLTRAAVQRYRHLPFRAPEDQLSELLDRDGPALARATLRQLGEVVEPPPGSIERRRPARAATGVQLAAATAVAAGPSSTPAPVTSPKQSPWQIGVTGGIIGGILAGLWVHRRSTRRPKGPAGGARARR